MKLGIVGSGMIVQDFLTITSYLKGTELKAICGTPTTKEGVQDLANKYKIENVFVSYETFLESDIDTVYVAVPNHLHFQFTKMALTAGKNVIVEKPFTSNFKEATILSELAKTNELLIFEATTTPYLPNYKKIKELLPTLGDIKIVQCNYSQYSSRYNSFKQGNVLPAFDPQASGGALMDLNIYNIHYVVGLFGKPRNVEYFPNIEKGIDTSGILILEYDTFKCTCIGAKDCKAPIINNIQGDQGCIQQNSSANICKDFEIIMNDGSRSTINENTYDHRMIYEFLEFEAVINDRDLEKGNQMLEHSLIVSEIQTLARSKAGIVFPADNMNE